MNKATSKKNLLTQLITARQNYVTTKMIRVARKSTETSKA